MPAPAGPLFKPVVVSNNFERDTEWHVPYADVKLRPGLMPTRLMTYADMVDPQWGMVNPIPVEGGPLVLVDIQKEDIRGNGIPESAFVFAKNTLAAADLSPSQTFPDQDDWQWPPVMVAESSYLGIRHIVTDGDYQTTIIDSNNPFIIPQTSALCRVKVEQWWTVTPWPLRLLGGPQPEPGWVRANYLPGGQSLNVNCLHPLVFIPGLSGVTSINGRPISPGAANIRSQIVEATNFETWLPFYYKDGQKEVRGRWFRERRRIFPPDDPYTMPRSQVASSG